MPTDYTTTYVTGKDVCANGFNTLGRVALKRTVMSNPVYHSAGHGGADRVQGNIDFEGHFMAWGREPTVFPNDLFDMRFTLTGATGEAVGSGGAYVRCTGLDVMVPVFDPKQENAVYYIVYFGAAGNDLVYTGLTAPAAPTTLTMYPVQGLGISISGSVKTGIESMMFRMRQQKGSSQPNSSTNGIYYRPIANLDYSYFYRVNINNMNLLPTANTVVGPIIMQTDGTNGWTSGYGRVMEHDGVFDHNGDKLIGVDVEIGKCISGTDAGYVKTPSGTTIWP